MQTIFEDFEDVLVVEGEDNFFYHERVMDSLTKEVYKTFRETQVWYTPEQMKEKTREIFHVFQHRDAETQSFHTCAAQSASRARLQIKYDHVIN